MSTAFTIEPKKCQPAISGVQPRQLRNNPWLNIRYNSDVPAMRQSPATHRTGRIRQQSNLYRRRQQLQTLPNNTTSPNTPHLNPKQALYNISRAFTAYQLTTLSMQKLKEAIKDTGAKIAIVSDITGLFLDNDLTDYEAQRPLSQITTHLSNVTRQNHLITIATELPHRNQKRNHNLHTLTCQKASTTLSLNQTKYARTIRLEKHPCFKLGSMELPSEGSHRHDAENALV